LDELRFLHLDWGEVQRLSEALAGAVYASGNAPEVVVAVSRGGYVPARILCDQLGVRALGSFQVESYAGIGKAREPRITAPLSTEVGRMAVLLVDDVSDSGSSLQAARGHVSAFGPSSLRVATLHVKPWTTYRPDYWVEETDAWIVYPWEVKEAAEEIAEKIRASDPKADIRSRLIEYGFSREAAEKYAPKKRI